MKTIDPNKKGSKYNVNYTKMNSDKIKKYILNRLKEEGFSNEAAISFIGNLSHESSNFKKFTEGAVNINNTKGVGIAQWTDNPSKGDMRGQAFLSWMEKRDYKKNSLEGNVNYLINEMKNGYYSSGKDGVGKKSTPFTNGLNYDNIKKISNINDGVNKITAGFFRPAYNKRGDERSGFLGSKERLNQALDLNKRYDSIVLEDKKPIKKFSDDVNLSKFENFTELMKREDEAFKTHKDKDLWNQNKSALKIEFQETSGMANINKGQELYNASKRRMAESEYPELEKIKGYDDQVDKLKRQIDLTDDESKKASLSRKVNNLIQNKNAVYANVKLKYNEKKLSEIKKTLADSDINSPEYKNALSQRTSLLESNQNINSGFKVNKGKDTSVSNITSGIGLGVRRNKKKQADVVDRNSYTETPVGIEDIYEEEVKYNPISISDSTNDVITTPGVKTSENTDDTILKEDPKEFTFDTSFMGDDVDLKPPTSFSDDKVEKQSFGDYLKDNPMSILSAALGVKGLISSQADVESVDVKDSSNLSESFYEHLNNLETISKKGFTPEEEAAFLSRVNEGYMASVTNAVRASGGNRAQVLAAQGGINANRNASLLDFSAADAKLHRENLQNYGKALEYKEAFMERKDVRQQTNEYNAKNAEYAEGIARRQGGAALAAGSLKSLITSIKDFKTTGTGSVLDRYTKRVEKNIREKGSLINPETNKVFANEEEYLSYKKKESELNSRVKSGNVDFLSRFNKMKGNQEDKKSIFEKYKLLDKNNMDFLQSNINDDSTFEELSSLMNPKKVEALPTMGMAPVQKQKEEFDPLQGFPTIEDIENKKGLDEINYNI